MGIGAKGVFVLSLVSSATGVVESICGFGGVRCVEINLWNFGCAVGPVGRGELGVFSLDCTRVLWMQFCDLSAGSSVMEMGVGRP